ncbi:MAG: SRPBCC domain-containing protein [Actinobacteria bacterium]|nr:SRPBCC domain-containing protein [Actinomycetota bacterium]
MEKVYDALATRDGAAQWWTRDVTGDAGPGGKLAFRFGRPEPAAVMELAQLRPPRRVVWRCVDGPDEWRNAPITYDLRSNGDETVVVFTHPWEQPVEFMHHCSTAWGYYLLSLKHALEGGTATPFPDSEKISSWG